MTSRGSALPVTHIRPGTRAVSFTLDELWHARELLYFLVWRDIKVRYKQTVLGIGWSVLQPFLTMVVFTIFFGRLAKVPSDGVPYPLFSLAAALCAQSDGHRRRRLQELLVGNTRPRSDGRHCGRGRRRSACRCDGVFPIGRRIDRRSRLT